MSKDKLKQHYLDTTYIVLINGKQHNIYINQVVPIEIQKHLNSSIEKTAAIITACNPQSQLLSEDENKQRNHNLRHSILDYPNFRALGQGSDTSWPAEKAFLILGINKVTAQNLAVKYKQNAYVWLESNELATLAFTHLWNE